MDFELPLERLELFSILGRVGRLAGLRNLAAARCVLQVQQHVLLLRSALHPRPGAEPQPRIDCGGGAREGGGEALLWGTGFEGNWKRKQQAGRRGAVKERREILDY
jgi:hypothetical protein